MQFILNSNSHHFQQYRHRHIEPRVYNMTSICLLTSSHLTANISFGSVPFFSNFVLSGNLFSFLLLPCFLLFLGHLFWELGGNYHSQEKWNSQAIFKGKEVPPSFTSECRESSADARAKTPHTVSHISLQPTHLKDNVFKHLSLSVCVWHWSCAGVGCLTCTVSNLASDVALICHWNKRTTY